MAKREAVNFSDDTYGQIRELAERAGMSVHAWLVAAVEREAFRQLCEKTNKWWQDNPEEAARTTEDFNLRQKCRTETPSGSPAA